MISKLGGHEILVESQCEHIVFREAVFDESGKEFRKECCRCQHMLFLYWAAIGQSKLSHSTISCFLDDSEFLLDGKQISFVIHVKRLSFIYLTTYLRSLINRKRNTLLW